MVTEGDSKILSGVNHGSLNSSDKDLPHVSEHSGSDDHVDTSFQRGVQEIEAVTISWGTPSLVVAFILIWLSYFIQGFVSTISSNLLPYVTSDFMLHSLTPTVTVLSSVIGGVTNLSIAKILDIFGRPQGFLLCVFFATIGLIMAAACNNVQAYAASQVFWTVGVNGFGYSLSVFVADTTTLRNRGLIQSLCASSNVITPWLGGPIATAFLNGAGWRWAFGMNTILVPAITVPLFGLFMFHLLKAKKQGLVPKQESGRTFGESLAYYGREFDIIGLLTLSVGIAFFLLPFNLYAFQAKGWGSTIIICFLVFGILLLIAFGVWERFFAKVSFVPWHLMRDRTVGGACILAFVLFFSYMSWGMYFSSTLQVVNDLSVTHSGYIVATYTVGGFLFAIGIGALMSVTGRYKAVTLYLAIPLAILGTGLLAYFNKPDTNVGYIAICMVFISFASGTIMLTDEIAILAAVKEQQHFAVAIALVSMFANIGSAVGLTVSAAVWTDVFAKKLELHLPVEELPNLPMIYMDIMTQLSYPVGSPTRLAISYAYGDTMKYLYIAGTAVWALGIVSVLMWKDIDIKSMKQTKGHVV
jgi:MFS family permease